MTLLFLYGPAAAGKLTIARIVAERTGHALFHNHLIVDAVAPRSASYYRSICCPRSGPIAIAAWWRCQRPR